MQLIQGVDAGPPGGPPVTVLFGNTFHDLLEVPPLQFYSGIRFMTSMHILPLW